MMRMFNVLDFLLFKVACLCCCECRSAYFLCFQTNSHFHLVSTLSLFLFLGPRWTSLPLFWLWCPLQACSILQGPGGPICLCSDFGVHFKPVPLCRAQVDQFAFVLTDLESMYRFGYCRHGTGAQTCLCIIRCVCARMCTDACMCVCVCTYVCVCVYILHDNRWYQLPLGCRVSAHVWKTRSKRREHYILETKSQTLCKNRDTNATRFCVRSKAFLNLLIMHLPHGCHWPERKVSKCSRKNTMRSGLLNFLSWHM